jgi:sigma-E factor negative regulatory protein RseC
MIEARAIVLRAEADLAVVTSDNNFICGACASTGGCGAIKLSRLLSARQPEFQVANPVNARRGEKVIIGVPEGALMKSSLAVYFVPLLLFIAGAVVGSFLASADSLRDGYAVVGSFATLPVNIVWLRLMNCRFGVSSTMRPVILRVGASFGS